MRKRTIAALVALPLFFLAVYFTPEWVLPVALGLLAGLAAYEMLHNTGLLTSPALLAAAIVLSVLAVPITFYLDLPLVALIVPATVVIFVIALASHETITCFEIFGTFFAVVFIPMALGSIVRIRAMENGISLVILPFITAWITDTFAYLLAVRLDATSLLSISARKKQLRALSAASWDVSPSCLHIIMWPARSGMSRFICPFLPSLRCLGPSFPKSGILPCHT